MSARSKARKRALDILYEAEMRGLDPHAVLQAQVGRREQAGEPELNPYVSELIDGVVANLTRIDELLSTYSQGWSLDRMPAVDRALLRLGCFEVIWSEAVPDAVAIAEAVDLAQELSTDESAAFVNGLLGRLSEVKPRILPAH